MKVFMIGGTGLLGSEAAKVLIIMLRIGAPAEEAICIRKFGLS